MPIANSATTNTPRPDLAMAFSEFDASRFGYVATQLFAPFDVTRRHGTFGKVPIEAWLQSHDTKRRPKGDPSRSDWVPESDTFDLAEYTHEERVDIVDEQEWRDWFNVDQVAAARVRDIIERDYEIEVKDALHNTTTFPLSGTTGLSITNEWDDAANAVPIDDVRAGINALEGKGIIADTLQINRVHHRALSTCDQIVDRLKYIDAVVVDGLIPTGALARVLNVERVVVAGGLYNSANPGATPSPAAIWSNEYAFLCATSAGADLMRPHIGRTFAMSGDITPYQVNLSAQIYTIGATMHRQAKTLYSSAGFLFGNCIT